MPARSKSSCCSAATAEEGDAGHLIWSAVTCHRFGLRRPGAVVLKVDSSEPWSRQVATDQSGDRSPHSKELTLAPALDEIETVVSKPVIFVVDDDDDARRVVAFDLDSRYAQKYRVLQAASGSDALETLRRLRDGNEPAALILASQRLPDMNGVEFLSQANVTFPQAG